MGHDYDRVLKVKQKVLKPFYGRKIKVVCGLVKKKYVRISKKRLGEEYLYLLISRKLVHFRVMELVCYAKTVQKYFGVAFRAPSVKLGKLGLKLRDLYSVLIAEIGFAVKRFLFLHYVVETFIAVKHAFNDVKIVKKEVILSQNRHSFSGRYGDRSGVRLYLSR